MQPSCYICREHSASKVSRRRLYSFLPQTTKTPLVPLFLMLVLLPVSLRNKSSPTASLTYPMYEPHSPSSIFPLGGKFVNTLLCCTFSNNLINWYLIPFVFLHVPHPLVCVHSHSTTPPKFCPLLLIVFYFPLPTLDWKHQSIYLDPMSYCFTGNHLPIGKPRAQFFICLLPLLLVGCDNFLLPDTLSVHILLVSPYVEPNSFIFLCVVLYPHLDMLDCQAWCCDSVLQSLIF